MESLLIKTLNSQDKSEELKFIEKLYNDDVNTCISVLTTQMEILQVLLKDGDYFYFDNIISKNRSAMRTWGLMLSFIPFGWNDVLKYQYLGIELLQVRRSTSR